MLPTSARRRSRTALLLPLAACCGSALACGRVEPPRQQPLPAPAGASASGLPPLARTSPRNASYTIDARLDPERHTIAGDLVLEWRNTSGRPLASFPFHLYWNAFRNNLSTAARREGRRTPDDSRRDVRSFGWVQVKSVRLTREAGTESTHSEPPGARTPVEEDLTPTLRYLHEDANQDDRTVVEVGSARPVEAEATVRFRILWNALIPHGSVGRSGWVHDYHFVAQWFPKIGVFWNGAWNCHPFYPWTEFFSDFGVYDVRLRLPRGFVVGATGRLVERRNESDGTEVFRFVQEDVHDFAWTASRRFLERQARFEDPGYPPVALRLLVQPEHAHLAARYLGAAKTALRAFGSWSAPYPYPQLTLVDPAWGSASGGMEYPTLVTGGARLVAPPALQSPEGVTVHEVGHQFWHGLVANNEFEEAWLDEGFATYMTGKALEHAIGPEAWGRWFFGGDFGRGASTGLPFVAPEVLIPRGSESRNALRAAGTKDFMARAAWTYRDAGSYRLNSYGKPALVLQTLEGLLGEQTMLRVLRTYARRFRFAHPTTRDFVATVDEVTGQDWGWFFQETFFSSELCDYSVEVSQEEERRPFGWFEGADGALVLREREKEAARQRHHRARVTVVRAGGARLPVELLVEFDDGRRVNEAWDGRDRWRRFEYHGASVRRAVVDPQRKIALDVDRANDEWIAERGPARRAATKSGLRFLLWLQTFLELQTVIG